MATPAARLGPALALLPGIVAPKSLLVHPVSCSPVLCLPAWRLHVVCRREETSRLFPKAAALVPGPRVVRNRPVGWISRSSSPSVPSIWLSVLLGSLRPAVCWEAEVRRADMLSHSPAFSQPGPRRTHMSQGAPRPGGDGAWIRQEEEMLPSQGRSYRAPVPGAGGGWAGCLE